jgi:dolichyl-phosphate-mannose--protein O-mannosyl transferase
VVSQLDLMPAAAAPARPKAQSGPQRHPAASRAIVALVLVVVAFSAVVRLVNLDVFPTLVFDEHYYVHDAGSVIHGRIGPRQPSPWRPGDGRSLAHPPLGTLSIAAGILTLGNNPWGWRVPSAIAGTLLIALVYPLARRLRLSPHWALAAVVLAASDTMLIVESRIGVLDPFVALWSAVCIYCALRYVQSGRPARWLALTGLASGLAIASKWSGILALVAAAAIVALDWARERRERRPALARAAACLVGLPLVVYVASYADYFASGHTLGQWLHLQGYMASFNWNVQGSSGMASWPLTWIFDAAPIWYRWALVPHGVRGMIAIGNPLLWWASVAAFVGLLWLSWQRRDGRLALAPLLVAILYLPWLATSRQSYIYYLTPAIPFLAILVAAALARLAGPVPLRGRWAALFFGAGAVLMGVAAGGTLAVRLAALTALVVVLVAVVIVARRRKAAERPSAAAVAAWLYTGAVAGLAAAWLPFLVSYAASFGYYERLAWFATWR